MLNTPTTPAQTNSNIRRFVLAEHRVEMEEKLPITDDARHGLSSLWVGLVGTLMVTAVIIIVKLAS